MRETVVSESGLRGVDLPADVLRAVALDRSRSTMQSALVWSEHCTECAWPSCFSNCSLYTPRADLKCRRFANGLEDMAIANDRSAERSLGVSFRKWGKLEAEGRPALIGRARVRQMQRVDDIFSYALDLMPLPYAAKLRAASVWNRIKKSWVAAGQTPEDGDAFVLECFAEVTTPMQIRVRFLELAHLRRLFERTVQIVQGHNRVEISVAEMSKLVDPKKALRIQIEPAGEDPGPNSFTFTRLEFVRYEVTAGNALLLSEPAGAALPAPNVAPRPAVTLAPVKCVVWDLDNTIWTGTLVESGSTGIKLKPGIAKTILELDERGVLQSIASKNDRAEAMAVLERFGLTEYFLYPQIHWFPKSQSLKQIAGALNLGLESFLFIDDEPFEREEVGLAHPTVRVLSANEADALLQRPEFELPVTAESRRRRAMYQEEEKRTIAFSNSAQDFVAFLRNSQLRLELRDLDESVMDRVFELAQRTNQLNYQGRRLSRRDLEDLQRVESDRRGVVMSCRDRFGDYGIIGFAVVDVPRWCVEDFFMSCRVQRKKVEQALIGHLNDMAARTGRRGLQIRYKRTNRNGAALEVLDEMGFQRILGDENGALFLAPAEIPDSDVVALADRTVRLTRLALVD